ncbi:geranylgeranyl diphosphate synthase CrtE [Brasilonema bromeliae]|uniref:Polyprenyl synthetase family protein n=1 Tax=Brasilonema bromeliae SPC951 TaxID=385972 RepID=A0ABX1P2C4_9CYAN|nr:farnesyl diphosphate synthase [Brasilonema bromeliae]NMG18479.1 polyprenyl synthetase family protein [Brasilonema bromeliae SPC951]
MNTKVFERSFQNSKHNQSQVFHREIEVANTKKKSLQLVEAGRTPEEATFNLSTYLSQRQGLVEEALERSITVVYPEKIYEAMRYSLLAGGKRLRPILCLASCELSGGTVDMAMPTACALEMVHTMSLIHDDLPAMDNDDYRRGKLTNHKVYGEDIAILAGDGLLAYAFEFIVVQTKGVPAEHLLQVVAKLSHAVAATGLVGGQVVDLESEGLKNISLETLNFIHAHKTGALLETSVVTGGLLTGADEEILQRLSRYACNIGLAFQIIDDVLDITATAEQLGKSAGKDLQAQKATYPSLLGIQESKNQAKKLIEEAKAELAPFGEKAIPLMAIADYITDRTH